MEKDHGGQEPFVPAVLPFLPLECPKKKIQSVKE
jgi:hypothetical protein